jgi:solute carrier family 25 protein 39/40
MEEEVETQRSIEDLDRLERTTYIDKIVASMVGSSLTCFIATPFDVVKARLQAQVGSTTNIASNSQFSGPMDAVYKISRFEGFRNLWRGMNTTLTIVVPSTALYFTSYEHLRKTFERSGLFSETFTPAMAGLSARMVTVSVFSPLELVRTHLQATSAATVTNQGVVPTLQAIFRGGGVKSLWAGLAPTIWRDAPFSAVYWTTFEALRRMDSGISNQFVIDFVAGATGGMLAAIITHPFDVVKTRIQMHIPTNQNIDGGNRKELHMWRSIFEKEGLSGFGKGMVPRVMKVAPSCAMMISCYELTKKVLSGH